MDTLAVVVARTTPISLSSKELAQKALQANKDHQYALKVYTERLQAELGSLDKLLNVVDIDEDDEPEMDVGGFVSTPGAKKAVGPISPVDLLSEDSPFFEDAEKRQRYLNLVTIHPMKNKELEALTEAVRTENHRKHAFESQNRGYGSVIYNPPIIDFDRNVDGIEWDRVAEKVSEVSSVPRTARECEIRWIGGRHPDVNHTAWTAAELTKLKEILKKQPGGKIDWVKVAKDLGTNRIPIDCMRKAIPRRLHTWNSESDDRLLEALKIYGFDNWNLVARYVSPDATAVQCQARYTRTLDPLLKRGPWTEDEDSRLRLAVAVHGNSWMEVASLMPGRTNEQCRDHWTGMLDPSLTKGKWTEEEDQSLLDTVAELGTKWKDVSERLGSGRTDSHCRSRYEKLKKQTSAGRSSAAAESFGSTDHAGPSQIQSESGSNQPQPQQVIHPKTRPRARPKKTSNPSADVEAVNTETSNPPAVQPPPRPKPRRVAKNKDKGKEKETQDNMSVERDSESNAAGVDDRNTSDITFVAAPLEVTEIISRTSRKRTTAPAESLAPAKKRRTRNSQAQAENTPITHSGIDDVPVKRGADLITSVHEMGKEAESDGMEATDPVVDPPASARRRPGRPRRTHTKQKDMVPDQTPASLPVKGARRSRKSLPRKTSLSATMGVGSSTSPVAGEPCPTADRAAGRTRSSPRQETNDDTEYPSRTSGVVQTGTMPKGAKRMPGRPKKVKKASYGVRSSNVTGDASASSSSKLQIPHTADIEATQAAKQSGRGSPHNLSLSPLSSSPSERSFSHRSLSPLSPLPEHD